MRRRAPLLPGAAGDAGSGMPAGWIICEPNAFPVGWRLPAQAHPQAHELVLVVAGRLCTRQDGKTLIAEPGQAVLHPAGMEHEESALGGRPLATIYLGWDARGLPDCARLPLQVVDAGGRIGGGLRWIMDICAAGTADSMRPAAALIEAVLHEFRRTGADEDRQLVEGVAGFCRAHLARPLRLGDLARSAGLSRHHFARRFHRSAGATPMQFLRTLRMQRARLLVQTTELPLAEVARQVGIPDRFHFSRLFSQHVGMPPGRLRGGRRR
jgi:AraC-like DNA-binding protein